MNPFRSQLPPPRITGPRAAHWRRAWLFALFLACAPALAQESPDPESLWSSLAQGAPAQRDAAADELLNLARRPEVARQVGSQLLEPGTPVESRVRVLAAVARSWDPSGRLFKPIAELAGGSDPVLAIAAMPALGAFRTREAFQAIIKHAGDPTPEPVRAAAVAALIQASGRDDLGSNAAAWNAWLNENRRLGPAEWQDVLARGVWQRSVRLAGQRAAVTEQLVDGFRRLYLALPAPPADDRPKLISQLLLGSQPELRNLAFDLVNRELSAGSPVDGAVTQAAGKLFESADPAVRTRAAALLVQLAPADAGARMASALSLETSPDAAEELLRGVIRWPVPAAREPVLHWLEFGDHPTRAAQDAALTLLEVGILTSPEDRQRALLAARKACAHTPTPAACRLRVLLGDATDQAAVIGLLDSTGSTIRLAAAQSLADRPGAAQALVTAAASDPALYQYAVAITVAHRPNLEGFEAIETLAAPSPQARAEGLRHIAAAMSAADLLEVADRPAMDPSLTDTILSRLVEHGPQPGPRADDPLAIYEGILVLARTRLALKRPDLALAALNALPPSPKGVDPAKPKRLRVIALLWTNHIADAAELNAPAGDWLDGLEAAIAEPHARALFREVKTRFGPVLSLDETRRLEKLSLRLLASPAEADAGARPSGTPQNGR